MKKVIFFWLCIRSYWSKQWKLHYMDSSDNGYRASIGLCLKLKGCWPQRQGIDIDKTKIIYLIAFHFHFFLSNHISVPIANILQLVHLIISNLRLNNLNVFECSLNSKYFLLTTAVTDGALFRLNWWVDVHAYIGIQHQLSSTCDHSKTCSFFTSGM